MNQQLKSTKELNELGAKVMGWEFMPEAYRRFYQSLDGRKQATENEWAPAIDMNQAVMVADAIAKANGPSFGWAMSGPWQKSSKYRAMVHVCDLTALFEHASSATVLLVAALLAAGEEPFEEHE